MMRLFVQHANRTVIVALKDGDTMTDLVDKCLCDGVPLVFRNLSDL